MSTDHTPEEATDAEDVLHITVQFVSMEFRRCPVCLRTLQPFDATGPLPCFERFPEWNYIELFDPLAPSAQVSPRICMDCRHVDNKIFQRAAQYEAYWLFLTEGLTQINNTFRGWQDGLYSIAPKIKHIPEALR